MNRRSFFKSTAALGASTVMLNGRKNEDVGSSIAKNMDWPSKDEMEKRMYNFWVTSEMELTALKPKGPWII